MTNKTKIIDRKPKATLINNKLDARAIAQFIAEVLR